MLFLMISFENGLPGLVDLDVSLMTVSEIRPLHSFECRSFTAGARCNGQYA